MAKEYEVRTTDRAVALPCISSKTVLEIARAKAMARDKVGRAWRFLRGEVLTLDRRSSATKLMSEAGGLVAPGGGCDD